MKRTVLLFTVVGVLLLVIAGGIAFAVTKVCNDKPCYGTEDNDQLGERDGSVSDAIYAKGGHDTINARRAGNDGDKAFGQSGNDHINTADGDSRDVPDCGTGNEDVAIVDLGPEEDRAENRGCEEVIPAS